MSLILSFPSVSPAISMWWYTMGLLFLTYHGFPGTWPGAHHSKCSVNICRRAQRSVE